VGILRHQLAGLAGLVQQVVERVLSFLEIAVLVELGSRRHLRSLGLVQAMPEHVATARRRILDEREKALVGKLGTARRLACVLELEQAIDDLLFTSLLHIASKDQGTEKCPAIDSPDWDPGGAKMPK